MRGIGIKGIGLGRRMVMGGGETFSPLDVTGLRRWYDADDPTTLFQDSALTIPAVLDTDPVGGWKDKSGNAEHATQGTAGAKPLLKLAIRNGKPVVRYDGINDESILPALALTNFTVYIAFQTTYDAGDGTIWLLGGSQEGIFNSGAGGAGRWVMGIKGGGIRIGDYGPLTFGIGVWQNSKIFYNGSQMIDSTTAPITGFTATRISHESVYAWDYGQNDIAEILVYNTEHDDTTRKKIENYLGLKWGVMCLGMSYTLPPVGPGLVLTFDDARNEINTYKYGSSFYGFRYMQARGLYGTTFVISDLIGTGYYMTSDRLQIMDAAGWLIANHTKTHTDLSSLTEAQQEAELLGCDNALTGWGLSRGNKHLAFPYGAHNANTFTAMTATGMLTGRSTVNPEYIDPATMVPFDYGIAHSVSSTHTLADLQASVNAAIALGKYCVMLVHGIAGGADEFASMAIFESFIDWIVAQNIPCLTVADLYALIP